MSKAVDNNGNPTVFIPRDYQELPHELLLFEFSYLSPHYPRALSACSMVSRTFKKLAGNDLLWLPIFAAWRGGEKELVRLAKELPPSWQMVSCRFRALSAFLSAMNREVPWDLVEEENDVHENYYRSAGPVAQRSVLFADLPNGTYLPDFFRKMWLPQPVVFSNNDLFMISHHSYVNKNNMYNAFFAPEGVSLRLLTHDGWHLYGLTDKGLLLQWETDGNADPINTFATALSKGELEISQEMQDQPYPVAKKLLYADGFLIIQYRTGSSEMVFEIIHVESKQSRLCKVKSQNYEALLTASEGQVAFLDEGTFFVIELQTGNVKVITLQNTHYEIKGLVAFSDNKIVFRAKTSYWPNHILIFNFEGEEVKHISIGDPFSKKVDPYLGMGVLLGDLLFLNAEFFNPFSRERISAVKAYDLRNGKEIASLAVKCEKVEEEATPHPLADMIAICLENQHLLEPAKEEPPKAPPPKTPTEEAVGKVTGWFSGLFKNSSS